MKRTLLLVVFLLALQLALMVTVTEEKSTKGKYTINPLFSPPLR